MLPVKETAVAGRMKQFQAIVFETADAHSSLSIRNRAVLDLYCEWLPRFLILDADDDVAAAAFIEGCTIFDRLVVKGGPISSAALAYQLVVGQQATREEILGAVFHDLADDAVSRVSLDEQYNAAVYWEERAQMDAVLGRKVCYQTAPRAFNKAMHAEQVAALLPALQSLVESSRPVGRKPNLLHYGCGVGRLDRICAPYVNNFGVDISPTMVKLASELHPNSSYRLSSELDNGIFPAMDAIMVVTVLHHNDLDGRRAIYAQCARVSRPRVRFILLEDFIAPDANSHNLYPLALGDVLEEVAEAFGGSCTLAGINMLGYKPNDYIQRSVLLELDIMR